MLNNRTFGPNTKTLLLLYRIVYRSTSRNLLHVLDPVHHLGDGLSVGAYPTSSVSSLLALSGAPPLYIRRKVFTANYFLALFNKGNHPNISLLKNADSYPSLFSLIVEDLGPLDLNIDILSIGLSTTLKKFVYNHFIQISDAKMDFPRGDIIK